MWYTDADEPRSSIAPGRRTLRLLGPWIAIARDGVGQPESSARHFVHGKALRGRAETGGATSLFEPLGVLPGVLPHSTGHPPREHVSHAHSTRRGLAQQML
jgi:hypothetical protein